MASLSPTDIWLLFEDTRHPAGPHDASAVCGYYYQAPLSVITAPTPDDLPAAFAALQQALDSGHHVAGWMAYEAGLTLEPRLAPLAPPNIAGGYLWMGVFDKRTALTAADASAFWKAQERRHPHGHYLAHNRLSQNKDDYITSLQKIHNYLAAGDIYQVNYTLKRFFDLYGSPEHFYAALRRSQPVGYSAYLQMGQQHILSLSPELFLQKTAQQLTARPMKGTAPRGCSWADDQARRTALQQDEKNRAENLMIVDLLRNDLGRLATTGSVRVPSLYDVERYPSVLQMTSTITATLRDDLTPLDVLKGLFPCGSITGAPKIRAMEIIHELETAPRGVYTGAIGYITPDGDMQFNIPIRTLTLTPDPAGHFQGEMGIGSGIVADSDPETEYQECLLKGQFAFDPAPRCDLIETFRWTRDAGYFLLNQHLARLEKSADYFGFTYDLQNVRHMLDLQATALAGSGHDRWRVRLLMASNGQVSITATALTEEAPEPIPTICLSPTVMQRDNPFLYHKTTQRQFYDDAWATARAKTGCLDVIFTNELGQLTEGAISNIFIEKDGCLYTPPIDCGLLAGTLRQSLLDDPAVKLVEKILTPADLHTADKLFIGNGVRGLVDVTLVPFDA